MKKITLNETDLMKIVKRILNEQIIRQFNEVKELNEDEINFLYWIFERELKPPFRMEEMQSQSSGWADYYNRDGEYIGWLTPFKAFALRGPLWSDVIYKAKAAYDLNEYNWWDAIKHHLRSWMENQINAEVEKVYF